MKYDDLHIKKVAEEVNKMKGITHLLDVGSDEEHLKTLLNGNVFYYSLDYKGKHDFKKDLEKPLNISYKFDVIVCLETLEHTTKPHEVMKELLKIGKDNATYFISMPNEYNFYNRINFLIGRKTSVQKPFRIVEEHRHIHQPRVKDIINFCRHHLKIKEINYFWYSRSSQHGKIKPFFRIIDKLINQLAKLYPSLFTRNVLIIGEKEGGNTTRNNT